MKRINKLLLAFFLILSVSVFAQSPQLTWEFKNVQIITSSGGFLDSLYFEVWISIDEPGFYFGQTFVSIEYPNSVFGSNIGSPSLGNLMIERGSLLLDSFSGEYKYNVALSNTDPQIISVIVQPAFIPFNTITYTEIPINPAQFIIFTTTIQDTCGEGQMVFNAEMMNGNQQCVPDCSFADSGIYNQDEMILFPLESCATGISTIYKKNKNIWASNNNIYVNVTSFAGAEIIITNLTGQKILRKKASPGLNTFQMNSPGSFYIVKVIGNKTVSTRKVFVL